MNAGRFTPEPIRPVGMTLERALEIAIAAHEHREAAGQPLSPTRLARLDAAIDDAVRTGANDVETARRAGVEVSMAGRRRRARGIGTVYEREQQLRARRRAERAA